MIGAWFQTNPVRVCCRSRSAFGSFAASACCWIRTWQPFYGATTKAFNQAVRRNLDRFPDEFLLALTNQDVAASRSQIVTLKMGQGQHRKYRLWAFTEHGAVMAATILNSPQAVEMSVYVVRAFVELRAVLTANAQLAKKLDALEKSVAVIDADSRRQFKELRSLVFALAAPAARED